MARSAASHGTQRRQRHHRRGIVAEYLAAAWLLLKGYRLLAHRYKTPVGEIDLIVQRGQTLVFVEVKARATASSAAESIHLTNQQRVVRAAQMYLHAHPKLQNSSIRFDAVLISCYRFPHHMTHAFTA